MPTRAVVTGASGAGLLDARVLLGIGERDYRVGASRTKVRYVAKSRNPRRS